MFQKPGVIGAGVMGIGIVTDLVLHGIESVLVDRSEAILERAKAEVVRNVRFAPMLKKDAPRLQASQVLAKIRLSASLEDVAGCDFIIENVSESWSIKQAVYLALDRIVAEDVCFAANTSCISITSIAGLKRRPERVVGAHFMNPVFLKPSVEVIRGYHTSDQTVADIQALLAQLGKEAIVVQDMPGFVSNRISHLYMNEAVFVVQDQVARPEQVDEIFKKCFGHAMGPLETADLIGLDTVLASLDVLYDSHRDPKFRAAPLLRKMVAAGLLGRKSGRGFYPYQTGAPD